MVLIDPEDVLAGFFNKGEKNAELTTFEGIDIYCLFMNIYLHNRLKQYDAEVEVKTVIVHNMVYNRDTLQMFHSYTFDVRNQGIFYEEIDSLIKDRINGH